MLEPQKMWCKASLDSQKWAVMAMVQRLCNSKQWLRDSLSEWIIHFLCMTAPLHISSSPANSQPVSIWPHDPQPTICKPNPWPASTKPNSWPASHLATSIDPPDPRSASCLIPGLQASSQLPAGQLVCSQSAAIDQSDS